MDDELFFNLRDIMFSGTLDMFTHEAWYHRNIDSTWSHQLNPYDTLKGEFKNGMFDGYWEKHRYLTNETHKYYYI